MTQHIFCYCCIATLIVTISGCHGTTGNVMEQLNTDSPIVSEFIAAGGGNPAAADEKGIAFFLNSHPDISRSLAKTCDMKLTHVDATWTQTSEGKICTIATEVVSTRNFYGLDEPKPSTTNSDKRTFSPIPGK